MSILNLIIYPLLTCHHFPRYNRGFFSEAGVQLRKCTHQELQVHKLSCRLFDLGECVVLYYAEGIWSRHHSRKQWLIMLATFSFLITWRVLWWSCVDNRVIRSSTSRYQLDTFIIHRPLPDKHATTAGVKSERSTEITSVDWGLIV
jgi:hypothetical protein